MSLARLARKFRSWILRFQEPHKSIWTLEYDLPRRPKNQPGSVNLLGWNVEYLDARSLVGMVKVNVLGQYNDFFSNNLRPRILDCGSNIGISVLRFKQLYPDSRITAFEPDPTLCQLLQRNIVQNKISDVEVVEAAVWTQKGSLVFEQSPNNDSQSGRILEISGLKPSNQRHQLVKSIDLSDYLTENVDLLKLDIEGAEFEVLESCKEHLHCVKQIMLEVHHKVDQPHLLVRLLGTLEASGFHVAVNAKYGFIPSGKPYLRRPSVSFDQPILIWAWRNPQ